MSKTVQLNRALGIDIGSTTVKVSFTSEDQIMFERYERHRSHVLEKTLELLEPAEAMLSEAPFTVAISGSAGIGMSETSGLPFVQEVYATSEIIKKLAPDTGTVIELGGEDAKIIFFEGGTDARMNGSCAGGTGAFIDQMASLLDMTIPELDEASFRAERIYPIASRCGVFAKTDVQALFNQGAGKEDVAASIYQAVVNQTIVGLAQGRQLAGKLLFLGGPLYYCAGLRHRFRETLLRDKESSVCPDYALYAVARGAAYLSRSLQPVTYDELLRRLRRKAASSAYERGYLEPLFNNAEEYRAFRARHELDQVKTRSLADYRGRAWLGIDSGSTTTKLVLISEDKEVLYSFYCVNRGSPVLIVLEQLRKLRRLCADRVEICGAATTGYGEALIKHAFHADTGLVETIAHYTAARHFQPRVDFILDVGGQDIKCFYIRDGVIDSIMLNEACSSGCGSFLETFAHSMGYEVEEFAKLGIKAKAPVDLGSRCTVFMNSSIKQAQREGAGIEDISAGLSISVVKNALYKVIRTGSPEELGKHIVVQGGTLLNDAVLRAFELELERDIVRPEISGLMGAFGAALYAMKFSDSKLLTLEQLERFTHNSSTRVCRGCANNCHLTINLFADGERFISGNQCQKPLGVKGGDELPNLYHWKRERLLALARKSRSVSADRLSTGNSGRIMDELPETEVGEGGLAADQASQDLALGTKPERVRQKDRVAKSKSRGKIGLPTTLSTYELAPLWQAVFTELGYEVVFTPLSTRKLYERGQLSIPSDTVCYPAKIMHGHVELLIDQGIDLIFYPSLTYNIDEGHSANHYNCPIVAYYGEVLRGNMESLKQVRFFYPYLNIYNERFLRRTLLPAVQQLDPTVTRSEVRRAVRKGYAALRAERETIKRAGEEALDFARKNNKRIMILAGRPYHIDPEICHGIDRLATSLGFVVVSEDSVAHLAKLPLIKVLNQWTYHSRLYQAAQFACENDDVELVQLVSFGCGLDAITSDEVQRIMEKDGKLYTQIKIDDIKNLGAVRIRLRSLLGALEARQDNYEKQA
ncbi:MAG TPA: 2-hydroxyglutaryl-CoA dehydratase [Clostridiaceae bacterium]|nr:2-hydroxyglutaryl-CoA dehydratase [Clostridiaceae bacterium]